LSAIRAEIDLGPARLLLGDSRAILPEIRGSFHAIVSDPPYGIAYDPSSPGGSKWHDVAGIVGDDRAFDPAPMLQPRVPMVLFGANHFASKLPDSRAWFVWDKRAGAKPTDFSDCELAWCSIDGPARVVQYRWSGADRPAHERGKFWHPTQKPTDVMIWQIERVSKPGQVVCDPYMGSGTTGVAALRCGRKFIGIEIEERWFRAAEERVRSELDQGRLL